MSKINIVDLSNNKESLLDTKVVNSEEFAKPKAEKAFDVEQDNLIHYSTMSSEGSSIKILNPCIEQLIPLKIEKDAVIFNTPTNSKIRDSSLDDYAVFYKAKITLRDKEIGEFHTRCAVHFGAVPGTDTTKHVWYFYNPLQSFVSNTSIHGTPSVAPNNNNQFIKLLKAENDYIFKRCDKNGNNIAHDNEFIFPSNLINFNQDYIKDFPNLDDKVGSVYLMARSKLYEHFNNKQDTLYAHPIEIREFSIKSSKIASPGKLIGTLNHEYGVFREFSDGEKVEFIFDDVTTKGKDVIITDKNYVAYSRGEDKSQNPQKAFLFLAKYKDDKPCQEHYYNNNLELKIKGYALGFSNNVGFIKIISNAHLHKDIDLAKLFDDNKDLVIEASSSTPDMHDLWNSIKCAANPMYADSAFI